VKLGHAGITTTYDSVTKWQQAGHKAFTGGQSTTPEPTKTLY